MAQAVGMAEGLKYLSAVGLEHIHQWELALTRQALNGLHEIDGVRILGPQGIENRGGVISFTIDEVHPHDVGQVMDQYGVAVRTGHHCAWPLIRKLGVSGTTRARSTFITTWLMLMFCWSQLLPLEITLGSDKWNSILSTRK